MENIPESEQFKQIAALLYGLTVFTEQTHQQMLQIASEWSENQDLSGTDLLFLQLDFQGVLLENLKRYPAFMDYMTHDVGRV